jgi:hypothetical protein
MPRRKDLAAALAEEHAVRPEALLRARREHERTGRPLWAVLIEAGLCTEDMVFLVLRRWSGAPVLEEARLSGVVVPAELRTVVPRELASEQGIVPLERSADGKRVAVAMVDPLAEVPALRAGLARQGVSEVHRFLLHLQVLNRCLPALYAEPPAREEELPLSDRPTGLVTLPERDPRLAARPRPGPRQPSSPPLLSPPVQPFPSRAAVTQPLPPIPTPPSQRSSKVSLDPQLVAEIEMLSQGPGVAVVVPTRPPRGEESTQVSRPLAAPQPPAVITDRIPPRAPESVPPAPPARGEETRIEFSLREPRPQERAQSGPAELPWQHLKIAIELLLAELEGHRLPPSAPRAAAIARLTEAAALKLDLPRPEELGLLALLHAAGRITPPLAERARALAGIMGPAAHGLVAGAAAALSGPPSADLQERLLLLTGTPEIVQAVLRALADHPELLPEDPDPTHELTLPLAHPADAPSDPKIELAEVSESGLELYQIEEK